MMKSLVVIACMALTGCAGLQNRIHLCSFGSPISAPRQITAAQVAPAPPERRCDVPAKPAMPDPATTTGLVPAVDSLKARDRLWTDYARRLELALTACK